MKKLKKQFKNLYPYFSDVWQYLIIIGIFIIAGIIYLIIK